MAPSAFILRRVSHPGDDSYDLSVPWLTGHPVCLVFLRPERQITMLFVQSRGHNARQISLRTLDERAGSAEWHSPPSSLAGLHRTWAARPVGLRSRAPPSSR